MNYDKLTETLRQHGVSCVRAHGRYCSICDEAATALSTLQAENEKLRAEAELLKKGYCAGCSIPAVKAEQIRDLTDAPKLRAELEQVKRGNDALWTYIEIVDREYRRYMDRGYIDRLDELKRTWKCGQEED